MMKDTKNRREERRKKKVRRTTYIGTEQEADEDEEDEDEKREWEWERPREWEWEWERGWERKKIPRKGRRIKKWTGERKIKKEVDKKEEN